MPSSHQSKEGIYRVTQTPFINIFRELPSLYNDIHIYGFMSNYFLKEY
jgi:hypothetical protein